MPLRLPPLSSLRFFEAAGRCLSFKRAAAELNVTPSAVSHGIVGLEKALGTTLFVRGPRGLTAAKVDADDALSGAQKIKMVIVDSGGATVSTTTRDRGCTADPGCPTTTSRCGPIASVPPPARSRWRSSAAPATR